MYNLSVFMKKNAIFTILAASIGIVIAILLVFAVETIARLRLGDRNTFVYIFRPKLLCHAAIFNRSLLPSPSDQAPRIFCLGGSTTHGNNVPAHGSFPFFTQLLLKRDNKEGTVYNYGVAGVSSVTTNFFIKRIVSEYKPQCVVLHDGYNDIPIVLKKLSENRYSYIRPDYTKPYNPYIRNGLLRYLWSFNKINLRAIKRTLYILKEKLKRTFVFGNIYHNSIFWNCIENCSLNSVNFYTGKHKFQHKG